MQIQLITSILIHYSIITQESNCEFPNAFADCITGVNDDLNRVDPECL